MEFFGAHQHRIDAKGRVALPAEKKLCANVAKVGKWVKAIKSMAAGINSSQP